MVRLSIGWKSSNDDCRSSSLSTFHSKVKVYKNNPLIGLDLAYSVNIIHLYLESLVEHWVVVVHDQFCNSCPAAVFGCDCCLEEKT